MDTIQNRIQNLNEREEEFRQDVSRIANRFERANNSFMSNYYNISNPTKC